jgi:glycosyltransferase involved in cell wall biosynthesis
MEPKHVGMVVDNELIADVRVLNEALFLRSKGWRVSVLCFDHGTKQREEYDKLDLEVHFFKKSLWWKNKFRALMTWLPVYERAWRRRVTKFYEDAKFDIIHVHDLYMSKTVDRERVPVPLVLDLHENWPEAVKNYHWSSNPRTRWLVLPALWKKKENNYLAHADGFVLLSPYFKNKIEEKFYSKGKHFAVYPNVPYKDMFNGLDVLPEKYKYLKDKLVLLYFGKLAKRRGILNLLEAVNSINNDDIHLLLIGPVEKEKEERIRPFIKKLEKQKKATWIPWIELSELSSFMPAVDLGVSPIEKNDQHDIGVANKVFQYMLFGKPLIVSNSTAQRELVEEADSGWVFASNDVKALKSTILEALGHSEEWKEIGENGQHKVLEKYTTKVQGENILKLYASLLDRKN